MYQIIHEPLLVAGVYKDGRFIPKKFRWQRRDFMIAKITLESDVRDGVIRTRWYSVLVGRELYRLLFNRETEEWWLEELWVE